MFGTKNGWERARPLRAGRRWRRSGADQRRFGWARPPWFDRVAAEHAAFRERVGIIDMTSFGKLEVSGPGALALLERVCDSRIDRPVGSVIYTQFLTPGGGIVADVTVTRLGEDAFRVITGAGDRRRRSGLAGAQPREPDEGPVSIRDCSDELRRDRYVGAARARRAGRLHRRRRDDAALPFRRARRIGVAAAPVLAQRITYVGELGYELYVAPEWAVQVWDRLMAPGPARHHPRRLPRAGVAAAREGLPLLRHRPDRRRHARTRAGWASASRSTKGSSSAAPALAAPEAQRPGAAAAHADRRRRGLRDDLRRRGGTPRRRRWSDGCAAAATATRCAANIALAIGPGRARARARVDRRRVRRRGRRAGRARRPV